MTDFVEASPSLPSLPQTKSKETKKPKPAPLREEPVTHPAIFKTITPLIGDKEKVIDVQNRPKIAFGLMKKKLK
jgi:hypothetical protein